MAKEPAKVDVAEAKTEAPVKVKPKPTKAQAMKEMLETKGYWDPTDFRSK